MRASDMENIARRHRFGGAPRHHDPRATRLVVELLALFWLLFLWWVL